MSIYVATFYLHLILTLDTCNKSTLLLLVQAEEELAQTLKIPNPTT